MELSSSKGTKLGFDAILKKFGLPVAIAVVALILVLPAPKGLTAAGHSALALFAGIFILFLTEAVALPVTSLAIVPLAVLMGVSKPADALSGFASTSVYLIVGAFVLATAMAKSRLADRITYLIIKAIGTTTKRITIGIMVGNIALAFLVPSTTARTAIMLPIVISIIKQYNIQGRSKLAVNLLLTLAFTNCTISAGILTAVASNPIVVDFIAKAGGGKVTFSEWFILGFPAALLITIFTWWIIQIVYKPEVSEFPGGKEFVVSKLKELGAVSADEKRAIVVFSLVVILWALGDMLKVDATIACLLGAVLLFLPKIGFLTWSDANKGISWQTIFIVGGGISLGSILMTTGVAAWLAKTIFKALAMDKMSLMMMFIVLMFVIQYLHFVFVSVVSMSTALLPIILSMAQVAHVSPKIFALPLGMIIGGYPIVMFYCTVPSILCYGSGELKPEDFPKVGVIICAVACILYAICAVTYWPMVGLKL